MKSRVWLLVAFALVPARAPGQDPTGAVSGTVTDKSGSALIGSRVTARVSDTGLLRSVATGDEGRYLLGSLAPGTYELRAAHTGFSDRTRLVTVRVGDHL